MIALSSVLYLILFSSACAFAPRAIHRQIIPSLTRLQSSAITLTHNYTHHDELLWGMTRFFGDDMVDSNTNRFYYVCHPQGGECEHVHFPIRDLAAAWDASKALEFTKYLHAEDIDKEANIIRVQQRLTDAIKCTISVYHSVLNPIKMGMEIHLNEGILLEPPTIGHSALLLLGMCNSCRLSILVQDEMMQEIVDGLAQGILSMQIENGAFRIEFGKAEILRGIEFFPGEAMLSLMSVHELSTTSMPGLLEESTRRAILPAMERAFGFYSNHYYTEDVSTNFNIWQVLAFAKYYDALDNDQTTKKVEVRNYVLDMCQEICKSRSWKYELARGQSFYVNLETVEIACGLDALAEGIRIAQEQEDLASIAKLFKMHATNALYFLKWTQEQVPEEQVPGKGGLGHGGTQVFEQRLDVTGHAISALVKLRKLSVLLP